MNKLIVESKNDKAFIEALIRHLNVVAEVDEPIFIDEFENLDGSDSTKLRIKLGDIFTEVAKYGIKKIGILIDIDDEGFEKRIKFINDCLEQTNAKSEKPIVQINQFIQVEVEGELVEIACFFTNLNGKGELETLLKAIKSQNSTYADCLENWRNCLKSNEKAISDKDFDKFWIANYIRYDTCSKRDKKQVDRKCSLKNFDTVLQKEPPIFDFEHPVLEEMKDFLRLFK